MQKKNKPNFFIIGAPKCGTTSIYSYLKQHPQIFMSEIKEPHFFGKDLTRIGDLYNYDLKSYLNLFKGSSKFKIRGEASTYYLYSNNAVNEIHSFSPNAKILILLRDPTEMIYSMHSQFLYSQNEDVKIFNKALKLENKRMRGDNFPALIDLKEKVFYYNYVKILPKRIKKYLEIFGEKQVCIMLLDDIKENIEKEYDRLFHFLQLTENFKPIFSIENSNKQVKIFFIQELIKKYGLCLGKIRKRFISNKSIGFISFFDKMNTRIKPRQKMDSELKIKIKNDFNPIINELEDIINRDLSKWKLDGQE